MAPSCALSEIVIFMTSPGTSRMEGIGMSEVALVGGVSPAIRYGPMVEALRSIREYEASLSTLVMDTLYGPAPDRIPQPVSDSNKAAEPRPRLSAPTKWRLSKLGATLIIKFTRI
ncbi:hypothetical protein BPNSA17_39640 [Bordetella petrii]